MKTTKKTAPTIKSLQAELKTARTDFTALEAKYTEAQEELTAFRQNQQARDEEINTVQKKIQTATVALKPFLAKTKGWTWPAPEVEIMRPLTFGDVKRAAEAAAELA